MLGVYRETLQAQNLTCTEPPIMAVGPQHVGVGNEGVQSVVVTRICVSTDLVTKSLPFLAPYREQRQGVHAPSG